MKAPMVGKVTEEVMTGSSPLIKKVNAFLTTAFIGSSDLPADECESEAEDIVGKWLSARDVTRFTDYLELYFAHQFWDGSKRPFQREAAESLVHLLMTENTFQ